MVVEKTIHDPVHGSMRVGGLALDLVDTPEVQRLRRIRQLGLANLVFPGANHTRFEHILGVAYLTERLVSELGLPEEEHDLLAAAAMLHDIGHPPYSHTLEYLMLDYLGKNHMELTGDILRGKANICTPEEREKLRDLGIPTVNDVLSEYGVDTRELARLLLGKHQKPYLGQIIHGDVDVDQMDYLLRDAHFTGVALGRIDIDRLMRTLIIYKNHLVIASKGVEAVESLLTARALMFSSVYFHHTTRIAELMFANAVDYALSHEGTVTRDNFYQMGDEELAGCLYEMPGYPRDIIIRLRYRRLFKTAYVEERRELDIEEKRHLVEVYGKWSRVRELQGEIARRSGLSEGEVILDVPVIDISISEPRLERVEIPVLTEKKSVKLSEISPLAKALQERQVPRYFLRVITPAEHVEKVRKAALTVLG